ncbi:LuxR C-terminal-related transcriptional regulator [Roseateles asaccharophilus]|uniref:LuxR family maltose regulon positive regulatory protein n=1 Tax=Roseateles asaccharophilus TaxID=582607 RepID=A0ABU2AAC1_9BURK|nr:LuxR C-terminal-related transcriptional regulator [Roseateles asaccharophilus]MDR7333538.1 LuxR family maltose regulon positive regulatory protein [Roseateles asaccharophilus]
MALAHTKTRAPQPREGLLLPRPGLLAQVERALAEQRVLLINAPAGYGKTALLTQALAARGRDTAIAWVALDEGDDLGRLLDCLFAAFEPFDPPWRTAPEGLRDAALRGGGEITAVADAMLNALEACEVERGLIVLDDVHHLQDAASVQFLDRWLARMGWRWRLVLSARHEPPLRLARLRATGELADLGPAELALARDEVERLAHTAGLDGEAAAGLYERCQGWPAGVRLVLGMKQGQRLPAAIDRATFDYLAAEVLDRLDAGLRGFLLRSSVLYELDVARCQALGEGAHVPGWLAEIERLSLFVTVVDLAPHTLRLHQMFRNMLRQRLRQEQPDVHRELLERAAMLETDAMRRQGLLLAAGRPERAAELLLADGALLMNQLGAQGLLDLTRRFDAGFADTNAELHRVKALALWVLWEAQQAEWHLSRAEALFEARGDDAGLRASRAHRSILLIAQGRLKEAEALLRDLDPFALSGELRRMSLLGRTWHALESCRFDAVAPLFEALVAELEQSTSLEAWYTGSPAPRQISCAGMALPVDRWYRGAMQVLGDRALPFGVNAHMAQAWNLFWQGRLPDARQWLARAESDAAWFGRLIIARNHGQALHAMLDLIAGQHDSALELMRLRLAEHVPGYGIWGEWHATFFMSRMAAACGNRAALTEGLARLARLGADLNDLVMPYRPRPLLGLQAQLAALEGRRADAIAAWRGLLADGESGDLLGQLAEARLLLAEALLEQSDRAGAAQALAPALARREPGGLMWVVPRLLRVAGEDWGDLLDTGDLARLRGWADALRPATQEVLPVAPADERLSQREAEVIAQIAAGASNKHIARALDLSPHTVKRHVANILDKLGLNSRGEAAAWWNSQRQAATRPGALG